MFTRDIYLRRRQQLTKQLGSGIILLLGNEQSSMNFKDNYYPFRQDSSFLYFFGLDRPGLVGIINIDEGTETIYGNEFTVEEVVWNGTQKTLQELAIATGVSQISSLARVETAIGKAREINQPIHFLPPYRPENLLKLSNWFNTTPAAIRELVSVPLIKAIVAQRSIKSAEEITEIEKAVNITVEMQLAAMQLAEAGMTEAEVAGKMHAIAIGTGGNLSFPSILTVNGQILHNHYGNTLLREGQLVLCDCGAETDMHYAGDLTRTFPVSNLFSEQQKEVYEVALTAYNAATAMLKPGVLFRDVHLHACEKLVEGLQQLGLMKGDVQEAVAQGAHALFYPCGLGHLMGLDTHDMEDLGEEYVGYTDELKKSTQFGLRSLRLGRALEAGFVLSVEPGLYFIPELMDRWYAQKKFADFINYEKLASYWNFGGLRVEDNFLITPDGSQLLGNPLPLMVDEIGSTRTLSIQAAVR